jgi:4-carboxymuconolactone decarboxylase
VTRPNDARSGAPMSAGTSGTDTLPALDDATVALVRAAAAVTAGSEAQMRESLTDAARRAPAEWVEELILQSYLFAGFPRALNAMREWRRVSGTAAPAADDGERFERAGEWREQGEATCATVYGRFYAGLRHNIRELHPALDAWMVVEGYGKVLSRPGLDLARRELCIVAACAAARQDRQLHSHLHGALHAGATGSQVEATLRAVAEFSSVADARRYEALWMKVKGR